MITLVTALYAEGRSDERFLPVVIQRALAQLLGQGGHDVVEVWEPMLVASHKKLSRAESILSVAKQVYGYHLLLVHADADSTDAELALQSRFTPGEQLIHHAAGRGERVCTSLIPIIPVHMTEAWMLADAGALIDTIGTQLTPEALEIPPHAHQIEAIADPKQRLKEIFQTALAKHPQRRRHQRSIKELYEPLGRRINLERLALLPSYQQFLKTSTVVLSHLNFLSV